MDTGPRVLHRSDEVTLDWVERALGRRVRKLERIDSSSTWAAHIRMRVHVDGGDSPLQLRVKIASTETFGTAEVDYYLRDFAGLPNAPLLHCHHGAADATHYHLLLDDVTETHRDQFHVPPSMGYGLRLVEAAAQLHAHRWPQPPPDPAALERALAPARAGLAALLDAMEQGFTPAECRTVRALLDRLPDELRARLDLPAGFTWLHGDLNPGNVLAPIDGPGRLYLIDHQPFAGSDLVHWLGVSDLAHAIATWWPEASRRACERTLVAHWHAQLVSRGVKDYPLSLAWDDWRLCTLREICVPAARCSEPGAVTAMRWVWEPQLRRILAAAADLA